MTVIFDDFSSEIFSKQFKPQLWWMTYGWDYDASSFLFNPKVDILKEFLKNWNRTKRKCPHIPQNHLNCKVYLLMIDLWMIVQICEFESHSDKSFNKTLCDKVCQWLTNGSLVIFSPVSSTNKTDRHDISEILLKVALNTKTLT